MSIEHVWSDIFWLRVYALTNRTAFAKNLERANADRTQYVRSSSGLITAVTQLFPVLLTWKITKRYVRQLIALK